MTNWLVPTVTASAMIAQVMGCGQGQMSQWGCGNFKGQKFRFVIEWHKAVTASVRGTRPFAQTAKERATHFGGDVGGVKDRATRPLVTALRLVCSLTEMIGAHMVKVSVLYPNRADTKFDMMYYLDIHIPMVRRLLGSALKGVSVEHGISGEEPGSSAPYIATGHLVFDSVQAFQTSFGSHAEEIMADIPKYTNSEPLIQIGEVKL